MITFLDDQVGIIMDKIKQLGLDNNTIIMFSSDNGATFSAGVDTKFFNSVSGLRGLKMDVYEGGISVPFIARWPGNIKPNTTSNLSSVQYDLMATIEEITGTNPGKTDGISFLPTLTGKTKNQKIHDFLYFEYPENGGQLAVRLGDWKGVKRNVRKEPNGAWELYNMATDRKETNNVAALHADIIQKITEISKKAHTHPVVLDWEFVDPKTKK
jgi:arylsulfatase A-like enzyme